MNNKTKIWIIIAIFFIVIGSIIFFVIMNKLKWDFTKLSTIKFETNEYEISNNFKDITIITNTADIVFLPSLNSNSLVVSSEEKNVNHSVKVENGTLLIQVVDTRKWYEHIGINFNTPKITIYIPRIEYQNIKIKSSTGDIKIPNDFKFKNIDITVSTGDIINNASVAENIKIKTSTGNIHVENIFTDTLELYTSTGKVEVININCNNDIKIRVSTGKTNITDTNCKNLISSGSTGNMYLENVIAKEKFSLERTTGDVKFKDSDATDIIVKTDTGNVIGSLLTNKIFFVKTDTGKIEVPKTMNGGKCDITTDTGDIKIIIN